MAIMAGPNIQTSGSATVVAERTFTAPVYWTRCLIVYLAFEAVIRDLRRHKHRFGKGIKGNL